jgi:hypothetical protein
VTSARSGRATAAVFARAVLTAAACGLVCAAAPVSASAQTVRATRVVSYVPVIPRAAAVGGHCWTRSLAAPNRSDADRCMAGDSIYDPCFAPRRPGAVVVCDVNPATGGPGFAMRLTRPLRREAPFAGAVLQPWIGIVPLAAVWR